MMNQKTNHAKNIQRDWAQKALGTLLALTGSIGFYVALSTPGNSVRHVYAVADLVDVLLPMQPAYENPLVMSVILCAILCGIGFRLCWASIECNLVNNLQDSGHLFEDYTPNANQRFWVACRTVILYTLLFVALYSCFHFLSINFIPFLVDNGMPPPHHVTLLSLSVIFGAWVGIFYICTGCLLDTFLLVHDASENIFYSNNNQLIPVNLITRWAWIESKGQIATANARGQLAAAHPLIGRWQKLLWPLRFATLNIETYDGKSFKTHRLFFTDRTQQHLFLRALWNYSGESHDIYRRVVGTGLEKNKGPQAV